jgi:hypothetical protein
MAGNRVVCRAVARKEEDARWIRNPLVPEKPAAGSLRYERRTPFHQPSLATASETAPARFQRKGAFSQVNFETNRSGRSESNAEVHQKFTIV